MTVFEAGLFHLALPKPKRSLHALVLVDKRVLRIVMAGLQLIGFEGFSESLARAATGPRQILDLQGDREGAGHVIPKQRAIVSDLVCGGKLAENLHIALAETDAGGAVAGGELGRQTGIEGRYAKAITADELLLTEAWKLFVRRHAGPYRVVVGRDVLEALFAHALRDQSLGLLDRLNQFAWRHAKFLG